jgi:hypothetical protein
MSSVSTIGLVNGGTAGFIWVYLFSWLGFLAVNTSMAEMGSMCVLGIQRLLGLFLDLTIRAQGTYFGRPISLGFRIRA